MIITLREKAYQHIRRKIQLRELTAGNRLEEVKFAKELGVSRVPVREAMCQLECEGLLCQIPRLGMFVKIPNRDDLCDWCESRAALEGYAAEKAAAEALPQDVDKIVKLHSKMLQLARQIRAQNITDSKQPLVQEWNQTDLDFHMAIVDATQNKLVVKLVSNLHVMDMSDIIFSDTVEPIRLMVARVCKEHGRVLRAIRQHNPEESRQSMVSQLMFAKQLLLAEYDARKVRLNYWDHIDAGLS